MIKITIVHIMLFVLLNEKEHHKMYYYRLGMRLHISLPVNLNGDYYDNHNL